MSDDDLRTEIVALRNRLAELEARVGPSAPAADVASPTDAAAPTDAATPTGGADGRRLSRRGLLAAAVAGGAGLVATQVTTAAPAAAAPGGNVVLGSLNDGGGTITTVRSSTGLNSSPFAVVNPNPNNNSIGLVGNLGPQTGRFDGSGWQRAAVVGESRYDTGVTGMSRDSPGVYGESEARAGVQGESVDGYGVWAYCTNNVGVVATTAGSSSAGVLASAVGGAAVDARSSSGYGVVASGGRAPLLLTPASTRGAPKSGAHQRGELYVDSAGVLFFCVKPGTPGTWKKVAFS